MKELKACDPLAVAAGLAEMEFRQLARFDAGHAGVFWSEAGGPSPWEMHPDCDEMLQVLEGEIEVEVLPQDGGAAVKTRVAAGSFIVVPRGCWHRQNLLARTKELYLTPGRSLQSTEDDPRSHHRGTEDTENSRVKKASHVHLPTSFPMHLVFSGALRSFVAFSLWSLCLGGESFVTSRLVRNGAPKL